MLEFNIMAIIFRKEDFNEIQLKLVMINLTSGTEIRDYKNITLNELRNKGMDLTIPNNSCNSGHNLMFIIFEGAKTMIPKFLPQNGEGKNIIFSVTGKVDNKIIDTENKKTAHIRFRFTQYEIELWEHLLNKLNNKQMDILDVIGRIQFNG